MDPAEIDTLRREAANFLVARNWLIRNADLVFSSDPAAQDDPAIHEIDSAFAAAYIRDVIEERGIYAVLPVLRDVEQRHREAEPSDLPPDAFGELLTDESPNGRQVPYKERVDWRMASAAMTLPPHVFESIQELASELLNAGADDWSVHGLVAALTGAIMFPDLVQPRLDPEPAANWLRDGF